jgi:hypothetical protein
MANSDAALFLALLTFLAIWTGIIGVINLAAGGQITMGDMGALASPIPGQTVPNIGGASAGIGMFQQNQTVEANIQDYMVSTGYDTNLTKDRTNFPGGPYWMQADGVGFTCTGSPFLSVTPATLAVLGLVPEDNIYTVTYNVNNPSDNDFYTTVYSDASQSGIYLRYNPDGVGIYKLTTAGMLQPSTFINLGFDPVGITTYPYANAHKAQQIVTKYDSSQQTVEVTIDGNYVGKFQGIPNPLSVFTSVGGEISFSGVSSYHAGMIVESVLGHFSRIINNGSPEDLVKAVMNFLGGLWAALSAMGALIAAAVGLTSQSAVPAGVWAVVGLPAIATLIYLYAKLARGGG